MKISMRKVLTLLAISAMALPTITAASIDTNLKYGARGTEVSELQEFLIDKGFLSGAPTGNFFSLTLKAVIAYQTSVSLPATGFVGPMTRNAINQELVGNTSEQAEVTETGTTTPAIAESPLDLLKKQVALLMQQIQVLQGQATTQNQILQNQQAQQVAQNQQAQQTQQQLGQIVANTTPTPTPQPTYRVVVNPPTPIKPALVGEPILTFEGDETLRSLYGLEFDSTIEVAAEKDSSGKILAWGTHVAAQYPNRTTHFIRNCNATWDRGHFYFEPKKTYTCDILLTEKSGVETKAPFTFTVPI